VATTSPLPDAAAHKLGAWSSILAKRFYSELFGWRFENVWRGDRPYVIAGNVCFRRIVDVSAIPAGRVSDQPVITLDWTATTLGVTATTPDSAYRLV
jgi:hypothetical protein